MADNTYHSYYRRRNNTNGWDTHYFKTSASDVLDSTTNGNYRGVIKAEIHTINDKKFTSQSGITLTGDDIMGSSVHEWGNDTISNILNYTLSDVAALNTFKNTTVPNTYLPKTGGEISDDLKVLGRLINTGDTTLDNLDVNNIILHQLRLAVMDTDGNEYSATFPKKDCTLATDEDLQLVRQLAEGKSRAVSYNDYRACIDVLNPNGIRDLFKIGDQIFIQTLSVPDIWVMGVRETSSMYTYTNDVDFALALKAEGGVQVGYFVLSALETNKVDLSNVAKLDGQNVFTNQNGFSSSVRFDGSAGFFGETTINGKLKDKNLSAGTSGQALLSDGNGVYWGDIAASGDYLPLTGGTINGYLTVTDGDISIMDTDAGTGLRLEKNGIISGDGPTSGYLEFSNDGKVYYSDDEQFADGVKYELATLKDVDEKLDKTGGEVNGSLTVLPGHSVQVDTIYNYDVRTRILLDNEGIYYDKTLEGKKSSNEIVTKADLEALKQELPTLKDIENAIGATLNKEY